MNIGHRASRLFTLGLTGALGVIAAAWPLGANAELSPEGPTGKISQPIISGDAVSTAQQRELGLVTINGGCSGTLLNTYWVLTASHCVTTDAKADGPDRPIEQITITATWRSGTVTPIRSVRYWNSNRLDVALLFLGRINFGSRDRNTRLIYHNKVDTSMTLTKFGQGICAYATGSGPSAQPAQSNCGYRTVKFSPSSASATSFSIVPNKAGQITAGGDSGGPDYVTDGDGNLLSIAGVSSTCRVSYVAGKPSVWAWVNSISGCSSAALFTIRDDIVRRMKEEGPPDVGILPNRPGAGVLTSPDSGIVPNRPGAAATFSPTVNCKPGFVWRVARPEDLVCVTPAARSRTARENAEAPSHVDPAGAYGPNTCASGYVWRDAFDGDVVCVTPATRALVSEENRLAPSRRADH